MDLEGMPRVRHKAIRLEGERKKLQFEIGMLDARRSPNIGRGFELVACRQPFAPSKPEQSCQPLGRETRRWVECDRCAAPVLHSKVWMILQVAADFRTVGDNRNPKPSQHFRGSNTGEHQHLWRVDCTAAQDDLCSGAGYPGSLLLAILHADGARAVENDPLYQGTRFDP